MKRCSSPLLVKLKNVLFRPWTAPVSLSKEGHEGEIESVRSNKSYCLKLLQEAVSVAISYWIDLPFFSITFLPCQQVLACTLVPLRPFRRKSRMMTSSRNWCLERSQDYVFRWVECALFPWSCAGPARRFPPTGPPAIFAKAECVEVDDGIGAECDNLLCRGYSAERRRKNTTSWISKGRDWTRKPLYPVAT